VLSAAFKLRPDQLFQAWWASKDSSATVCLFGTSLSVGWGMEEEAELPSRSILGLDILATKRQTDYLTRSTY